MLRVLLEIPNTSTGFAHVSSMHSDKNGFAIAKEIDKVHRLTIHFVRNNMPLPRNVFPLRAVWMVYLCWFGLPIVVGQDGIEVGKQPGQ